MWPAEDVHVQGNTVCLPSEFAFATRKPIGDLLAARCAAAMDSAPSRAARRIVGDAT
jgi:hypothetical protein